MKTSSSFLACLFFVLVSVSLYALNPDEWKFRQTVARASEGAVRFSLPSGTLDTAQPDLRDLRIVDSSGKELPFLLMRPTVEVPKTTSPKSFQAELTDTDTVITLESGTAEPLESVELQSNASRFLKSVQVELSADGEIWQTLSENTPIFRQENAAKTSVSLGYRSAAYVRLTLGDDRTKPIVVTGAVLKTVARHTSFTEEFSPRIVRTDEFTGESVLTLDLGAKNLTLASLEFSAEDALFTRNVTVTVREFSGSEISERVLARGALFRVALDPFTPTADMRLPVNATVPSREVIIHIENGENPPLHIYRIVAERHPVQVATAPQGAGDLALLTGNPAALTPRYDLGRLASRLADLPLSTLTIDEPLDNPNYQQSESAAVATLDGGPLDVGVWKFRRTVSTSTDGVEELELDLHALANAQDSLADLRLVQNKKQIPYVLQRTGLTRELVLTSDMTSDAKQPSISRWQFKLPQPGLLLSNGMLTSQTPQFERRIRVYETRTSGHGEPFAHLLAEPTWIHAQNEKPAPLTFAINQRLETDTVVVETDNGSTLPIDLTDFRVRYPSVRLLFKTASSAPIELYYGNEKAEPARYEAALIAGSLLSSSKSQAILGPVVLNKSAKNLVLLEQTHSRALMWLALGLAGAAVVAVVVVKFWPKLPPHDLKM